MNFLAHRGFWKSKKEQNTLPAFIKSIKCDYGIELDIRDHLGDLVISHDPIVGGDPLLLSDFIKFFGNTLKDITLAINIKSDGLADQLNNLIRFKDFKNFFCFDMSTPQIIDFKRKNINIAYRISEIEDLSLLKKEPRYLWIDTFDKIWYDEKALINLLNDNTKLFFVSEDLHDRDNSIQWQILKNLTCQISEDKQSLKKLYLCTDKLDEAEKFFNEY